ncbi:ATPase, AAA family protein [Histomonas meleagridis]|uniref:ATPase, AAA family protein n=1 Tax=Histomonas meleagridis TaxID=135588 RepID=UPI00355AB56F|nr:ATPase, AAA family protein [Histomonas meleagridis]KAH0800850.1 ATPase, AAA family protein [Histomonas meleagridis]
MLSFEEIALAQQRCKTQTNDFCESEKKRRVRDSLVLCLNHLFTLGYVQSAEKLAQEAGIGTDRFELCDNITLMRIIVDYEQFYESKYGYKVKFVKPVEKSVQQARRKTGTTSISTDDNLSPRQIQPQRDGRPPHIARKKPPPKKTDDENQLLVNASSITVSHSKNDKQKPQKDILTTPPDPNGKLLDPVPPQLRSDFGDLTSIIARDIFTKDTGITWTDIVGLDDCKRVLRESVVLPLKFPNLFKDRKLLQPWRGVLLHGPPGTGKTLLAKAVAHEGTTFFNISASTIVSKYHGDSEKLIRVLFELARYHSPSTIFIDELDSIMSRRSTHDEHEASRRMKTELLIQMDGLSSSNSLVFVLAASNFPFDLDPAILRRLDKRILVPLPDFNARADMFKKLLTIDITENDIDFDVLAEKTDGYSGSDIKLVCKEAAMLPLRRLLEKLQKKFGDLFLDIVKEEKMKIGLITMDDVLIALERTKASEAYDQKMYVEWQEKYGVV